VEAPAYSELPIMLGLCLFRVSHAYRKLSVGLPRWLYSCSPRPRAAASSAAERSKPGFVAPGEVPSQDESSRLPRWS
jgi:hypothetical protein